MPIQVGAYRSLNRGYHRSGVLAKVAGQDVLYSNFFRVIPKEIPVEMDWESWFVMAVQQDGTPVAVGLEGRLQTLSRTAVSFSLNGTETLGITLNGTTVFGIRVTDYFPSVSNLTTLFTGQVADRVPVEVPLGPFSRFQVVDQNGHVFDDLQVDRQTSTISLPLRSTR